MATLVLAAAGSAIGGAIGGSVLGISAAVIGQTVGAYLGSQIDAALAPGLPTVTREGPRINTLDVMTANAGDPLADVSGRAAVAGTVIWATKIKETIHTDREKVKTGKRSSQTVQTVTYSYSVSMAIALGEGPLAPVHGRIWADGKVVSLSAMK
ncbi:hypothetical protein [Poseidonocella sp. HB161398]|uniref:hypothetical protein n=1 Tax=Poseidonocella sp. HB161398 TaxID=2320855 RepID=UPI001109965C|nr:hypothetical protein [Poseidonocella sp. HB161398]